METEQVSIQDLDLDSLTREGYRIFACDSQVLSSITTCERRTNLRFMRNLELIEEDKANYLDRGDLMHTGLKVYNTLKRRSDKFSFKDQQDIAVALMRKKTITLDIDNLEGEEYVQTFLEYTTYRKTDGWIPVEVEQPFSVLLHVSHKLKVIFVYEGIIDLVKEGFGQGKFDIVDYKGTKRKYSPLELSFQFMGYCWALGYNTLTTEQIGFQKTKTAKDKFLRFTFSYSKEALAEWHTTAVQILERWINSVDTNVFIPSFNGLACNSFNRLCPYYKYICKETPESREWFEKTRFRVVEPWSPWTRDDELDKLLEELIK